ncbi:MAG: hypothetical protein [Wendovervirus sonii]|uniref:Uncharacterized protein n=1 Tax=phage Lak_Megaphage_Sonny TaxID=3109229 RepID=A0ABZ0Z595_9CAUD|nr:MAG: hypothetical protein [phage Lak_Megaphage_Sonny]
MKKLLENLDGIDFSAIQKEVAKSLNVADILKSLVNTVNNSYFTDGNVYVTYEDDGLQVINKDNFMHEINIFSLFDVDSIYVLVDKSAEDLINANKEFAPHVEISQYGKQVKLSVSDDIEYVNELIDLIPSKFHKNVLAESIMRNIKKSLNESMLFEKQYINMDVELRKGGRNAVKMSAKDFEEEMIAAYKKYVLDFQLDEWYTRKVKPSSFVYNCCTKNSDFDKYGPLKMIQQDIWYGKYKFDNENCDKVGDIKMSKKGVPYVQCHAGGDWECPVCFFIYFDGTKFRGYVPLKGNAICKLNNSAFTGDNEEDSDEVKFLEKTFNVNSYCDLPVKTNNVDYNVDACLEDFESRIDVKGKYQKRDFTELNKKFDEYKKKKQDEKEREDN